MWLFYVDESGTGLAQSGKVAQSHHFVLASIGVEAARCSEMNNAVARFKKTLVPYAQPEDFELKAHHLRQGKGFFKPMSWSERLQAMEALAQLIARLPCRVFAVIADKRDLPHDVATDVELYRLAFWRLLDVFQEFLSQENDLGMVMIDARSDLHSSVQDRRLVDAYRNWRGERGSNIAIADAPWFGFSAFYPGLQLADFVAYLLAWESRAREQTFRGSEERVKQAYRLIGYFRQQVQIVTVP